MKEVKLPESGFTAYIKTSISYGEHQSMQRALMSAATGKMDPVTKQFSTDINAGSTVDWAYSKMLAMIVKIVDSEGKEIKVDRNMIDSLDSIDGEVLENAVDTSLDKIQKKSEKIRGV